MATILAEQTTNTAEPQAGPADVCADLGRLADRCDTSIAYYGEAFRIVADHFHSPCALMRLSRSANASDKRFRYGLEDSKQWESIVDAALLECETDDAPAAHLYSIDGTSYNVATLAAPFSGPCGARQGAVALIVCCDNADLAKAYFAELKAILAFLGTRAALLDSSRTTTRPNNSATTRALAKSARFESLQEMAFDVVNSLKSKFSCDQATLGLVEHDKVRILAISGLDDVSGKSPAVLQIRDAMHECLDTRRTICCQAADAWSDDLESSHHRLHRRWHEATGTAPVASIPLYAGDQCVAVISVMRGKEARFTTAELKSIEDAVRPFGPALLLVARATRGLLSHAGGAVRRGLSRLLAPTGIVRKIIVAAALVGAAACCLATIPYELTIPSRVVPTEVRYFAAPFEAAIAACHVDIGDEVHEGQLLYELDTADLVLERDKLRSQMTILALEARQAMAVDDVRSAALASSEVQGLRAELAIVEHKIDQAQMRAPVCGTVVAGDLCTRIGEVVAMGAPLLEIVPEGNWSVELSMPESLSSDIEQGFEGRFASNARPEEPLACRVVRIRPSAEAQEGKTVFVAEAAVDHNPAWMRSGMEGVSRIDAGQRPVWWVALHRVIDYVRLTLWI